MRVLERNLDEVTDLALKTGEKIVSVQCPCCSKTFYALESEVNFQVVSPSASPASLSVKQFGRKCPYCGYSGGVDSSVFSNQEQAKEYIKVEIEAAELAEEAAEKRQAPWSQICGQGVKFND